MICETAAGGVQGHPPVSGLKYLLAYDLPFSKIAVAGALKIKVSSPVSLGDLWWRSRRDPASVAVGNARRETSWRERPSCVRQSWCPQRSYSRLWHWRGAEYHQGLATCGE